VTDIEIEALWDKGNNSGDGYSVGGAKMSPWEAAEDEGYTDIRHFDTRGSTGHCVVARDSDGDLVAICDSHGPWAEPWAVTIKFDAGAFDEKVAPADALRRERYYDSVLDLDE
jgi:hypothetical protein